MNAPFSFSTSFKLDKAHFSECYAESVNGDYSYRAYFKASFLAFFGACLVLFSDINPYAAWFVFSLGILEALSVYYQKPWWVIRQMLSKASNSEINLIIDDQGITIKSFYVNQCILWTDISQLQATEKGWIVQYTQGRNYLSNSCLSEQAIEYLSQRSVEVLS